MHFQNILPIQSSKKHFPMPRARIFFRLMIGRSTAHLFEACRWILEKMAPEVPSTCRSISKGQICHRSVFPTVNRDLRQKSRGPELGSGTPPHPLLGRGGGDHSSSTIRSLASIWAPGWTCTALITASRSACRPVSIFIASMVTSKSPDFTA